MSENDSELTQLWEEAVDEYIAKSKRSITQRWKVPIATRADLDNLIAQHETDFAQFRSSRKKFWGILRATMEQLQNLGNIAQAGLSLTPFAPAAVILEAGIFLINSGSAVSDCYDALETLFKRIRDITSRVEEYIKGNIDQKLRRVIINLLGSLLNVFCESEAAIRRGRGREMMHRALNKENKIQSALDQLNEWVQTELGLITAKTYATAQIINEKADLERDYNLLRRTLCAHVAADNEAFGKNIESSRLSRSGDWLLEEPLYKAWFRSEFPVLWILGRPGTGKTYLASRVLSHLKDSSELTSFFYIREGMNAQHTPDVILKTIAYQLTGLSERYREQAASVCRDESNLFRPESIWDTLFVNQFNADDNGTLYIIIDGVDEATLENQELLVKLAKRLSDQRSTSESSPAIQLMLLGRPDLDYNVSNVWRGEKRRPKIIQIQPSLSQTDVERFIKKGVTESIPLLQKMRPGPAKRLRREITKTLGETSDGMFMLAKLMLAEVKDMNKPELIREALDKPPSGLDDMFKRVIMRLDVMGGFDKADLNELIIWVACAKRDLLLGELDLVLKLRDLGQDGIIGLEDELRTRFGSFFSVMNAGADSDDEDGVESVASADTSTSRFTPSESSEGGSDFRGETEEEGEDDSDSDSEDDADDDDDDDDEDDDDDDDDDVPYNYHYATVKFGHASVGQHFRAAPLHRGIGMDLDHAQGHITLTCLLFLTDRIPKKMDRDWREPSLLQYSVDHFLDHFGELNLEALQSRHLVLFKKLQEEVKFLLKDSGSLLRWLDALPDDHKFLCQLFDFNTCVRLQQCISGQIVNRDEFQTVPGGKTFAQELLEPFAQYVVQGWLGGDIYSEMLAVMFIQAYQATQNETTHKEWNLPPNRPFEHLAERISPEEIRAMASLGGLEKDYDCCINLGTTFIKIKTRQHTLAAAEEFEFAVQMGTNEEQQWRALNNKAHALVSLGDYKAAIIAATKAIEIIPEEYAHGELPLLKLIQNANLRLGNRDAALEVSLKAAKFAPKDPVVGFNQIFTAHRTGNYSETLKLVKSAIESEEGANFLGRIIISHTPQRYTTEYMAIAAQAMGELDTARDAFEAVKTEAIRSEDKSMKCAADAALAQLYFGFYRDDTKAISLWETMVTDYPSTEPAFDASFALMPLYFTKAKEPPAAETQTWVSKMEHLVALIDPMYSDDDMFPSQHETSALLGRWYADHGQNDLARAKILPMMQMAIEELTDRDDENDYSGYSKLARALLCFGDRKNAAIAGAITKPLRKSRELREYEARQGEKSGGEGGEASEVVDNNKDDDEDDDEEDDEEEDEDDDEDDVFEFIGRCDGGCDRSEALFRSFSMCEICVDVTFCDECHQKLIDGKNTFRICDAKHPVFEIYPPRGLVSKDAEGFNIHLEEGDVITADEWLGAISRDWLGV